MSWRREADSAALPGRLEVHPELGSRRRRVWVWTPPGYSPARRYPTLVFQDGQNLFLDSLAFAGSWRAAETLAALAAEGRAAVAVGVANAEEERIAEYAPFADRRHGGGGGDDYLRFLADEVLPAVGERWAIDPRPAATGLVGSSLGGLLALYGVLRRPEVFGLCAALSPSCWFAGGEMARHLARAALGSALDTGGEPRPRIYLDVGRRERAGQLRDRLSLGYWSWRYVADVRRVERRLRTAGWGPEELRYREEPGAGHTEPAWARRLPGALRFLLPGREA